VIKKIANLVTIVQQDQSGCENLPGNTETAVTAVTAVRPETENIRTRNCYPASITLKLPDTPDTSLKM